MLEAFELRGIKYWMFDSSFDMPTGRAMAAMSIYQELEMRTDREYILKHCRAVEHILSGRENISLPALARINENLKERANLGTPFPDHIYKLASVIFFDKTESVYNYDYAYNLKKIAKWKAAGGTLDFFLKTPLKDLIPFIKGFEDNAQGFFSVAEEVNNLHHQDLSEVLSKLQ